MFVLTIFQVGLVLPFSPSGSRCSKVLSTCSASQGEVYRSPGSTPTPPPSHSCPVVPFSSLGLLFFQAALSKCWEVLAEKRRAWPESPSLSSLQDGLSHVKLPQSLVVHCQLGHHFVAYALTHSHCPCCPMEVTVMTNVSCVVN